MDMKKLIFYGKYYSKNGVDRYYFDNLNNLIGLKLSYKKNGYLHRAYLGGKQISNKLAKQLDCTNKTFYYDVKKKKIHYTDDISEEAIIRIVIALS